MSTPGAELERRQQVNQDGPQSSSQPDYVEDEQFQTILDQLKSVSISHPSNYVSDDVSAEEIMQILPGLEQAQVTSGGLELERTETTTSSDVVARGAQPTGPAQEPDLEPGLEPGAEPPTGPAPEAAIGYLGAAGAELSTNRIAASEEEFESILERLGAEALDSLDHPMNYVNDEAQLQLLVEKLSDNPNPDTLIKRWHENKPLVDEDLICPICLEEMDPEVKLEVKLECRHTAHEPCLVAWARELRSRGMSQVSCPVCRALVQDLVCAENSLSDRQGLSQQAEEY